MLLLNSDRGQARELLDSARAMSSGFNARVEIGLLILGHPVTSAAPLQIPAETARQLAAQQTSDEQVDDRNDHSAMIPARQAAQAGSNNRAPPAPNGRRWSYAHAAEVPRGHLPLCAEWAIYA